MKAKEYLQKIQKLDILINQKIKELDDLRLRSRSIGSIDYSRERVQTSLSGNAPFIGQIERIYDLDAEINAEIDIFVNEKHRIINQIQGLKNVSHIALLYKRYIEFKKFETIADEMNFTYQYAIELHGDALADFQTTYENLLKPM